MINRVAYRTVFQPDFMLVMATNPVGGVIPIEICALVRSGGEKVFWEAERAGADRIDICIAVGKVQVQDLGGKTSSMSSLEMRKRVDLARQMQKRRFQSEAIDFNAQMNNKLVKKYCAVEDAALELLDLAYEKYHLSARGYYKIIKVARTVADTEGEEVIRRHHLLEAVGYRNSLSEL